MVPLGDRQAALSSWAQVTGPGADRCLRPPDSGGRALGRPPLNSNSVPPEPMKRLDGGTKKNLYARPKKAPQQE